MLFIKNTDFIVILTGAGISAESGIQTFRASDGLWENHRVEDVATPEGFQRDPELVWRFYKARYFQSLNASPNPGHNALVELERRIGERFFLVTQNVDGLHLRAGSQNVVEMHGRLNSCFCSQCASHFLLSEIDLSSPIPLCLKCKKKLRPDIVWFGEMPYCMDEILLKLNKASIFLTIGTSGNVYPAANFIEIARHRGAKTVGVNLDLPLNKGLMDDFFLGKAGEILPTFFQIE